jgi:ceramide glucosyltransferase
VQIVNLILLILIFVSSLMSLFVVYSIFAVTGQSSKYRSSNSSPDRQSAESCQTESDNAFPPVSILKPLRGVEPGLEENLSAFCRLSYPNYELVFCLEREDDPALAVVRGLKKDHPEVPIKLAVGGPPYGLNPKVSNLFRGLGKACHEIILISDSDVCPDSEYLHDTASFLADPAVGLVTNIIRGKGGGALGAVLENLHLNFFVLGATCLLYHFLGCSCVTGKSMLFRKADLEKIGGLEGVKDCLAEDYILGMKFKDLGKKVVLCSHMVTSDNTQRSFSRFIRRAVRWSQMRRRLAGLGYFSEILADPVPFAVVLMVFSSFSSFSLAVLLGSGLLRMILEWVVGRRIRSDMKWLAYTLVPFRNLLQALIWFVPFFKATTAWGGRRFRLKADTELEPI